MKPYHFLYAAVIFLCLIVVPSSFAYEAYFTTPGTRAMGMGGAFIAQSDDSSASWYNPAGLMQEGLPVADYSIEYGGVPQRDDAGVYTDSKQDLKSAGVVWRRYRGSQGLGLGLLYFKPYRFSILGPLGLMDYVYNPLLISLGGKINEDFSLGGTVGFLLDKKIDFKNEKYNGMYELSADSLISFGAIYRVVNKEKLKIKGGIVFRPETKLEVKKSGGVSTLSAYIPKIAESRGGGLNIQTTAIPSLLLSLNAGYEQILWAKAFTPNISGYDYTRTSIGGEATTLIGETPLTIRGGYSNSVPGNNQYTKITSITFGAGVPLKSFLIDFALENRQIDKAYNFLSLSLSYQH